MIIDFKKLKEIEGITPDDIAKTLGISQSYVSGLLNGKKNMSKERWEILLSKFSNITKYIIDPNLNATEEDNSNITRNNDSESNITEKSDDLIPAYILKMHNEERIRFDAQMDKMIEQNGEMLQQNRILVETLREQARILNSGYYSSQVAENPSPTPYKPNENKDK